MTISLIRTLLLYVMIIAAVRIMGKRQISELQTSELVVTLLISDIAAIPSSKHRPAPFQRHYPHFSAGILRDCRFLFYGKKIPGSVNWLPESLRWLSITALWIRHK